MKFSVRGGEQERTGTRWQVTGSSGREASADDVEAAGHAAWEMAHDDDAVQVRIEARR